MKVEYCKFSLETFCCSAMLLSNGSHPRSSWASIPTEHLYFRASKSADRGDILRCLKMPIYGFGLVLIWIKVLRAANAAIKINGHIQYWCWAWIYNYSKLLFTILASVSVKGKSTSYPADPFTISAPQNTPIYVSEPNKICDPYSKLLKGSVGHRTPWRKRMGCL